MAPQSRSSQPTIRERLGALPGVSPAVKASSVYTYDEARPGYVERNYLAGNDMGRLAKSLAGFDQSLIPVMEKYYDRKIERDIAKGAEIYAQNEALDKNRTNWKDYVEAHPEFRGLNPYLQKGYEQARLQALAIDQGKAMDDTFVQSGMVNERDQEKVNKWVQEFTRNFRKENHLDTYEDRLMLAESFSPNEFKNRAALLNKHSMYLQKQNEARAVQQFSDLAVKEIEATFDPSHGGRLFGDPATSGHDVQTIADIVGKRIQDGLKNGVLNANAGEMACKIILTSYEKLDRNPNVLKSLDYIKTPDGVTVSSLPGVAEKIHNLKQARIEEDRSAERHWWAQQEHTRKMEKQYFEGDGVVKWSKKGLPPTTKNMDAAGVPKYMQPTFAAAVNKWNQAQYTGQKEAPFNQLELAGFQMRAARGELDNHTITELAALVGYDTAIDLYNKNKKAKEDDEKVFTDFTKGLMSEAYRYHARDKKDVMGKLDALSFGFSAGLSKEQQIGIEAEQIALYKVQLVRSEYVEKHKKEPTEAYLIAMKPRILTEINTEIRAKYGSEAESGNGLSIPGQNAPESQKQVKPQLSSPHKAVPNTAAPHAADPLNTVVSEWINANGLDTAGATTHMSSAEKTRWVSATHPNKIQELTGYIQTHLNKARR